MLFTSMKLPGQPWMKSKGMASLRLERWWTKCNGTGFVKFEFGPVRTEVVNWLYLCLGQYPRSLPCFMGQGTVH